MGERSAEPALRPSPGVEIDAERLFVHMTRPAQHQPMFSKPLACPSTLDRRAQLAGCGSDVLRGGALEPGALARMRRGTFLSQAGPQVRSELVQLSITSLIWSGLRTRNDEGDPFGSPSLQLSCAMFFSACTSQRGLVPHRSARYRRPYASTEVRIRPKPLWRQMTCKRDSSCDARQDRRRSRRAQCSQ